MSRPLLSPTSSLSMLAALAVLTTGAQAADIIERAPQKFGDCVYELSGGIEPGDLEKVRRLDLSRERFNGESTANLVICLDSPGGDFLEGLRIAEHLHDKGAGTRLEPEARCFSACAIIFMMGVAKGGEVSHVNRSMHFTSGLGFHRPFITPDQAEKYTSEDVAGAFDFALDTLFLLTTLANTREPWSSHPLIRSDLMEVLLQAQGGQLFMIDTVDKAGRWNIRIDGIDDLVAPGAPSAYFACENALQWNIGRTENTARLTLNHMAMHAIPDTIDPDIIRNDDQNATGFYYTGFPVPEPDTSYRVTSSKAGYAAAGCHLKFEQDGIRICGIDEASDIRIGDGDCVSDDLRQTGEWTDFPLNAFPPDMALSDFGLKGFTRAHDSAALKHCTLLLPSGTPAKAETCVSRVKMHWSPEGDLIARDFSYLWPDGTETHLEIGYIGSGNGATDQDSGRIFRINNQITRFHAKSNDACFDDPPGNGFFCVGLPQ